MEKLSHNFFLKDTVDVAKEILGKILVHESEDGTMSGRIVETEAYTQDDPACHACKGMTKRNRAMFGPPGRAYVYFTYGFHYCLNFVTQPEGIGEAVLVRAIEPLDGIDIMRRNRNKQSLFDLCSGPGKLTQAFGIDIALNNADLTGDRLYILDDKFDIGDIILKPRVGIKEATDRLWRFYPANSREWVSKV